MLMKGKCPNYAGCLCAYRGEVLEMAEGEAFVCPECGQALMDADAAARKPVPIQGLILGGIALLVVMGAGAVWWEVAHMNRSGPAGQIGTSFEQAEVAASRGELLPSRHYNPNAPVPTPEAPDAPIGVYGYHAPVPTPAESARP